MPQEATKLRVDLCRRHQEYMVTLSAERIYGIATVSSHIDMKKGGAWDDRQAPESLIYMRHCAGGVQSRGGQVGFRCAWDAN